MNTTRKGFVSHHTVERDPKTHKVKRGGIRVASVIERRAARDYNRMVTNIRAWRGA
jgi:hypothetical protein